MIGHVDTGVGTGGLLEDTACNQGVRPGVRPGVRRDICHLDFDI